MTTFPTTIWDKALVGRADTSGVLPSWREPLAKTAPVVGSSTAYPEWVKSLSGSWAGTYDTGASTQDEHRVTGAPSAQRISSRLGLRGLPEINFRPYDWGTNRHGANGPSLVGHPVSFSVLGPTAKDPFLQFQWVVDTTGTEDRLILDVIAPTSTPADEVPAAFSMLEEIYNLSMLPESGLYLLISYTGAPGSLDNGLGGTVEGGLGDGLFGEDSAPPGGLARSPLVPRSTDSKFEVFRVIDLDSDSLTLDSGKRLSTFFTVPDPFATTPVVQAITLLVPEASRVVQVPGSEGKLFAMLPPARALLSDGVPPKAVWDAGEMDPWYSYATPSNPGLSDDWGVGNVLPVPVPLSRGSVRLVNPAVDPPVSLPYGRMRVYLPPTLTVDPLAVGRLLRLASARSVGGAQLAGRSLDGPPLGGDPTLDRLLGYWEIVDSGNDGTNDYYELKITPQIDPSTGVPFYGNSDILRLASTSTVDQAIWFECTFHAPVSSLWESVSLSPDVLERSRVTLLCDPAWSGVSSRARLTEAAYGRRHFPDRSIFDTSSSDAGLVGSNADPGNLQDLGYRVVLFPAKESLAGDLVPDFDHPITSQEILLDPSQPTANQYWEVDYASGLIRLSHAPVPGTECALVPDATVLTHTSNPRHEPVFFASFVVFSNEPGQREIGISVSGGQSVTRAGDWSQFDSPEYPSIFGSRSVWPLEYGQTVTSGSHQSLQLSAYALPTEIPPTGFVDVVLGDNTPVGSASLLYNDRRVCTFGYTHVVYSDPGNAGNTTLYGVFGGGEGGVQILEPSLANPLSAVLRRDVLTPNEDTGRAGQDFQNDVLSGAAKRANYLRFRHGALTALADGSVMVDTTDPRTVSHESLWSELFSSGVLSGGTLLSTGLGLGFGAALEFTECVVLIQGVRSVLPPTQITADLGDSFVYVSGANPYSPVMGTTGSLPLPSPEDVLLGAYTVGGPDVLSYQDLRMPLVDLDKRLDITVGAYSGHQQPTGVHFTTLAEAVAYVKATQYATVPGQARRIRVVGPTVEDPSLLPIRPEVSGLIIEGASWRGDGSTGVPVEVSWTGDVSLFDLSGSSNVVFRDLSFRYTAVGVSIDILTRNLFVLTDGGCDTSLFENIYLTGAAHGFYYASNSVGVRSQQLRFVNCVALDLTDFAIRSEYPRTTEAITVDQCRFRVRSVADVSTPELALSPSGVIHLAGLDGKGTAIRETSIQKGGVGIYLGGGGTGPFLVENCVIDSTGDMGLLIYSSFVTVRGCSLREVHTQAPTILPYRTGVYAVTAMEQIQLSDCGITISGDIPGDSTKAVDFHLCTKCTVTGVIAQRAITLGESSTVSGCLITSDGLEVGRDSIVSGCRLLSSTVGNLYSGDYCRLVGNQIAGSLSLGGIERVTSVGNLYLGLTHDAGNRNTFNGDIFGDPSGISSGRTVFDSDCLFSGCVFFDGAVTSGHMNTMSGCRIQMWSDVTWTGDDNKVTDCLWLQMADDLLLYFDGANTVFSGNSCLIGSIRLYDSAAHSRQDFHVLDNVLHKEAVSGRGGFWIWGVGGQVTGNTVYGVESESGVPDINSLSFFGNETRIEGNHFEVAMFVSGNNNRVVANNVVGATTVNGTDSLLSQTQCQSTALLGASGSVYLGNHFAGAVTANGASSVYAGNHFQAALTANNAGGSTFESNIGTTLVALSSPLILKGNLFTTAQFGGTVDATQQHLHGNRFTGAVTLATSDRLVQSVIDGNAFESTLDLANGSSTHSLRDCTFANNVVTGATDLSGTVRTSVSGNRFASTVTLDSATDLVMSGNWVGAAVGSTDLSLLSSNNYVVTGNRVTGEILVDGGGGAANTGVLMGNRAGSIASASVAPVNNQLTLGNKVDSGALIFSTAIGTASVLADNVTD